MGFWMWGILIGRKSDDCFKTGGGMEKEKGSINMDVMNNYDRVFELKCNISRRDV